MRLLVCLTKPVKLNVRPMRYTFCIVLAISAFVSGCSGGPDKTEFYVEVIPDSPSAGTVSYTEIRIVNAGKDWEGRGGIGTIEWYRISGERIEFALTEKFESVDSYKGTGEADVLRIAKDIRAERVKMALQRSAK